jgi:hypothetical protein
MPSVIYLPSSHHCRVSEAAFCSSSDEAGVQNKTCAIIKVSHHSVIYLGLLLSRGTRLLRALTPFISRQGCLAFNNADTVIADKIQTWRFFSMASFRKPFSLSQIIRTRWGRCFEVQSSASSDKEIQDAAFRQLTRRCSPRDAQRICWRKVAHTPNTTKRKKRPGHNT